MARRGDIAGRLGPHDARPVRIHPLFALVSGLVLGTLITALVIPIAQSDRQVAVRSDNPSFARDGRATIRSAATEGSDTGPAPAGNADGDPGRPTADESTAGSRGELPNSGTGGAEGPTAPDRPGAPASEARGVSNDGIKIGVAIPSLGAVQHLSAEFDIGDVQEQMEAILDGWQREGHVPVHGRDVEFIYREFDIFSGDEQIAACNGFVKDDKVFAVIGVRYFTEGARCLAGEHETPVVAMNGALESVYSQTWPFFVTVRASLTRTFRNWVHWADANGLLEGHRLGIYYETPFENEIRNNIEPELARLGYERPFKVEAGSGEGFGGGSRDSVAVQQFRSEGVDVLMPILGATQFASFMQQAEAQQYRPTYMGSDYSDHTSDATASLFPVAQYAGTRAMTTKRVGDIAAGRGPHPRSEQCVSNYERYSGREIPRESPESAEYEQILVSCDGAAVLLQALHQAGRHLTRQSLLAGIDGIDGLVIAGHGNVAYSSSRRDGISQQRTVEWSGDCRCWVASGDGQFRPFWVE